MTAWAWALTCSMLSPPAHRHSTETILDVLSESPHSCVLRIHRSPIPSDSHRPKRHFRTRLGGKSLRHGTWDSSEPTQSATAQRFAELLSMLSFLPAKSRKDIIGYTFPKSDGSAIATPGRWPGQRRTSQSPGNMSLTPSKEIDIPAISSEDKNVPA